MPEPSPLGTTLAGLRRAAHLALDWFYPRHCCHCGLPLAEFDARTLCADCTADLRALRITGTVCDVCGVPLSGDPAAGSLCIACRAEARHFDRARGFVLYAEPIRSVIHSFKFGGSYFLGPRVLRFMLERGWYPDGLEPADAVMPIPLHPRRRRERGYDQALLLARVLARRLDLPLQAGTLIRTRYTSQQARLAPRQRWDNVRGAFRVRSRAEVAGRRLMLVDDVLTTATTARECARVLKRHGAAHVQVVTLARTPP
ncbi:MAG: ComF family protein [Candidatus Brocadiaceae bacterium]|nr:ComF family protein [Candidatus Brocadiaceae bacterium]